LAEFAAPPEHLGLGAVVVSVGVSDFLVSSVLLVAGIATSAQVNREDSNALLNGDALGRFNSRPLRRRPDALCTDIHFRSFAFVIRSLIH
jgi:hypothetical protein